MQIESTAAQSIEKWQSGRQRFITPATVFGFRPFPLSQASEAVPLYEFSLRLPDEGFEMWQKAVRSVRPVGDWR